MKVVLFGMMRSGTTLLCDLLSVPGRSLVFSEPMMFDPWRDTRAYEAQGVARAFGLEVSEEPPSEAAFGSIAAYFEKVLEPAFSGLDFWGFKEVHFHNWRQILDHYSPDKLILSVRDLRDITLSGLDLVCRRRLGFTGTHKLRDEAWLVARLRHDVGQILQLRTRPHLLLRYEDLVAGNQAKQELEAFVGLDQLGAPFYREVAAGGHRSHEAERHERGVSKASVARFHREQDPIALGLANYVRRSSRDYQTAFGYEGPDGLGEVAPSLPMWEIENWRSVGPAGFDPAFARRRARLLAASEIGPGSRVLDLGCLLPVLRYLLPEECRYQGLDGNNRGDDVKAADWQAGEFPGLEDASLLTLLGSFEFIEDLKSFLLALRATGKEALMTYHAADDTGGLDRRSFGWRNHLTRAQIWSAFHETGFEASAKWAFDGYQSMFRLRPDEA